MAGWSILTDGCALDYLDILRSLQSKGFCLDFDSASMKACVDVRKDGKLRCLFEQVLFVFLKEVSPCESIRTLPAMLGDGRCVDLFKLFLVVREKGGYDSVSLKGFWALVAEELGLGSEVAASVKLLYIKYVYVFDRWVRKILKDKGVDGCFGSENCGSDFGLLPMGLATEFKGLLADIRDLNPENDEEDQQPESEEKVSQVLVAGITNEMENANGMSGGKTCIGDDDDDCVILDEGGMSGGKKCIDDDESCVILDNCVVKEECASGKRKRGSWVGMLDWVIDSAKRPGHLRTGKSTDDRELHVLALQARDLLSQGRHVNSNADKSLLQKKPRIHPSMYDDDIGIGHHPMERLRCSERIISQKNPCLLSSSESTDLGMSQSLVVSDSPALNVVINQFDDPFRKRVPLGPLFQAEVPEWTDGAADDDSKWLGTTDWPLATGKPSSGFDDHSIGKGREDLCGCRCPGSVECIRFHVAERKMKLKLELGRTFYSWGFRNMGEEVSLSWTEDEEKKFKDIVMSHPQSLNRCFWDEARKCFPNRCWKSLVRYYFNVFVLRRRSYQNRVTPAGIDSDDDESEFGSVSNGFGREAIKVPGSTFISCALNNQCIDLD